MDKKLMFGLVLGIFVVAFMQSVSAWDRPEYEYSNRYDIPRTYLYGGYGNFDRDYEVYRWDDNDLKWRKDPVNSWIQKGDGWKEEYRRARAVDWTIDSYYDRYDLSYGKASGDVHYYDRYTPDLNDAKPSNFRFKEAYDPGIHGSGNVYGGRYYYGPRYDYGSETFNLRY